MGTSDVNDAVLLQVEAPLAVVTLNRPHVLNAMTDAMMFRLKGVLDKLAADPRVRVLIITGSGRAFCAGSDIQELAGMGPEEMRRHSILGQEINWLIESMPKPVIAGINGYALGGGCELALACDIRIAAASAKMGLPEVQIGALAGNGGTFRLPRIVGMGVAKELLMTGRLVDAEEAYHLRMVNRVVEDQELMNVCRTLALQLAEKSSASLWLSKILVGKSFDIDWYTGLLLESLGNALVGTTEAFSTGIRMFLERKNK